MIITIIIFILSINHVRVLILTHNLNEYNIIFNIE
jgi:hypothetical protein